MAENEQPPLTPEKQLLKLIENPKQDALKAESKKREGKKWFSTGTFKGKFSFWKSLSTTKFSSLRHYTKTPLGIRQLNSVLKILIVITGLYFVYSIVDMAIELNKASNLIFEPEKNVQKVEDETSQLKNLSYYLDKVVSRSIFEIPEAKPEKVREKMENVVPEKPKEEVPINYALVGIAWSANPEAMIEDTVKKRTHFMHRGQMIDDDAKVVTIFKDKVILSVNGKEVELK